MMNKKLMTMVFATLCSTLSIAAKADDVVTTANGGQDGPWEVRLRGVFLHPANHSDAYAPLAIPADAITINHKWLPDLDFEYYFTPNWSSELILTYPQKQTVTVEQSALGGATPIGTFKHLPPTLTVKYGFLPDAMVRPYVGAGINVTGIMDQNIYVPTVGRLTLDNINVGAAAQAGMDVKLADHWFVNLDAKWVELRPDVKFEGRTISQVRVDPWLLGVGIGYRFGGY